MRIAAVSDIHGNLPALLAVSCDMARRGADVVVNLGDNLSGPLLPLETAHYLMARSEWIHLAGNHERQVLTLGPGERGASDEYAHSRLGAAELDWLRTLEPVRRLNGEVLLCHGTPSDDCRYLLETLEPGGIRAATLDEIDARLGTVDGELILCGHTHVPRSVRNRRGQLIVNPGSVGLQAYVDDAPWPHKVENGSPDARYAIVEHRGDGWHVDLISVPYDHQAMATLAAERHRPDWASGLASGTIA